MPKRSSKFPNADNQNSNLACSYSEPNICPRCSHALVPQELDGTCVLDENTARSTQKRYDVYINFFCPNCRKVFMASYCGYLPQGALTIDCTSITGICPCNIKPTQFPAGIAQISPRFVEIYNQAETAEANNLTEITGPGYRRALEFLVKDYLCSKDPDSSDAIKGELLGTALKRINHDRIHTLAQKATWLGNDATHYVWKHEDYDIEDLKRFIKAMLHYIESELAFDDALGVPYVK